MPARILAALLLAAVAAAADAVALAVDGVHLRAGRAGALVLAWPTLAPKDSSQPGAKPTVKLSGAARATLTYADGTVIDVRQIKTGLELTFNRMPADANNLRAEMALPTALRGAVTWQIGEQKGDFPAAKPEKPFLYQGNATAFYLLDKAGQPLLSLTTPEWAYQQLQDNREWKTDALVWWFAAPLNKDHLTMGMTIKVAG